MHAVRFGVLMVHVVAGGAGRGLLVVGASWVLERAANECLGSQLCMFGPVERAGCCWCMHIGG